MSNNPLKQYFRRPGVYLKLPSQGKDYTPDVIDMPENGELPIFPMTAIDEITARTPDALFNGVAVADLIKSCVPNIKDPWRISSNDLDAILIGIKAAAGGEGLEIESTCAKCEETSTYGVNLVGLLSTLVAGDYDKVLVLGDLSFKFRPLIYKEMNDAAMGQFEIQKTFQNVSNMPEGADKEAASNLALKRITELTMQILSKAIEYVQTPGIRVDEPEHILEFLQNCDRNVYVKVRDYNAELKMATQMKPIQIKCVKCSNEYEQEFTLNPSDFFA
jgi:hypothetical protein